MGRGVWQDVKGAGWGGGNREPWWSKRGWCWQSRWRPVTVLPVNHFLAGDNLIGWSDCRACVCAAAAIREADETNGKEWGSTITHALSLPHTHKAAGLFSQKSVPRVITWHTSSTYVCIWTESPQNPHTHFL